jgi:hypothetical protein
VVVSKEEVTVGYVRQLPFWQLRSTYTQSSGLRNTETAPTHQFVSYLNALPIGATHQCQGTISVGFRGERLELLRFLALGLFDQSMRFLAPPHQWLLQLAILKTEHWV